MTYMQFFMVMEIMMYIDYSVVVLVADPDWGQKHKEGIPSSKSGQFTTRPLVVQLTLCHSCRPPLVAQFVTLLTLELRIICCLPETFSERKRKDNKKIDLLWLSQYVGVGLQDFVKLIVSSKLFQSNLLAVSCVFNSNNEPSALQWWWWRLICSESY